MTERLVQWIGSLGRPNEAVTEAAVTTIDEWLERAQERPAWLLWGKAMPTSECPAHPLLCHMVDVAAVAARLLTCVVPRALRCRLLAICDDEVEALRVLLFVSALHDFGKATPAFQAKVEWARKVLPERGFDLCAESSARDHGDVGMYFLYDVLLQQGLQEENARALARAVTGHHGQFPTDKGGLRQPGKRERGESFRWSAARDGLVRELEGLFGKPKFADLKQTDHAYVVLFAGLTAVADWIGSMAEVFVYEPPQASLADYWCRALERADRALERAGMRPTVTCGPRKFAELFPDYAPWPLHEVAEDLAEKLRCPSLFVVEAPMGEGKTEAALLLAEAAAALGQEGFYIGLPTQATANQMFRRVEKFLARTRPDLPSSLLLAHGEASLVDAFRKLLLKSVWDVGETSSARPAVRAESWFLSNKRALLAGYAVGTIDQALLSVMLVSHAFVRLYGLAGKTVIFDEVHAYDTYTGTLLDGLLEWLAAAGTTVVLLSATLPSKRRAELIAAYQRGAGLPEQPLGQAPYPRVTVTSSAETSIRTFAPRRRSLSVQVELLCDDLDALAERVIGEVQRGGCVGWICNTVSRAQQAFCAAQRLAPKLRDLLLIHARLLPEERGKREQQLMDWLADERSAKERPLSCLVIGTQVLEQSLDVDFDLLVTDIAPVDLVLQRAGRLWRHERKNRSGAHEKPKLLVACPAAGWEQAKFDDVASVYDELFLRRTLRLLEGRRSLELPGDIEGWVEEVYAEAISERERVLEKSFIDSLGERAAQRMQAQLKRMPSPTMVDDPFGSLGGYLDDEDPFLHQHLRAETRLGPESVEIVCLERRNGQLFVGDGDDRSIDLNQDPDRELVARLVRRSISVTRPAVVRALKEMAEASPKTWSKSPLLRYRRMVAFEGGRAEIGGVPLELHPDLGLVIG